MSSITNCPVCQTQFVVTDEQLSQYNGKVRCGNCLNVFDATVQIVELEETQTETDLNALNETISYDVALEPTLQDNHGNDSDINEIFTYKDIDLESTEAKSSKTEKNLNFIPPSQPSNFDDLADKSKLKPKKIFKKSRIWLMVLFALILLFVAIAQSVYFLRNDIAIYYPKTKPYLVQICEKLACSIDLPKKIEFIVIDDSDIQEDADYAGLMHLSSTLINQASFQQAYPNLELTLTDTEDKPKLRRFFKPIEYL
ncbi:MAG: DUF3426 domain-containing protein, partial [Bacteroidia bacterium]|nr:DUF3426 domain-containing protein [Methylotenera sp.]